MFLHVQIAEVLIEPPVTDFGPFLDGTQKDQAEIAHRVDEALRTYGCLYLANHGIPQSNIDEVFQQTRRFHNLPLDTKLAVARSETSTGYTALKSEIIRSVPSLKESFGIDNTKNLNRSNRWTAEEAIPGFKEFMLDFHQRCTTLAQQFLSCLSVALQLPPTLLLENYHAQACFTMDLIRYPSISAQVLQSETQRRMSAHADFDTVTLLFQENGPHVPALGGLEAALVGSSKADTSASYDATGIWFDVPPRQGTVLVNVGHMLKRWTNGRWDSLIHRVGVPPKFKWALEKRESEEDVMIPERFSIPFFVTPDRGTTVEALPGTWDVDTPRKWGPLDVKDFLRRKRKVNLT